MSKHSLTRVSLGLLFALAVGLAILFVGGCSTNAVDPFSDSDQSKLDWLNQVFNDNGPQLGSGINLNQCPVLFDTTLSQVVDWRGCQIDMAHGNEKIGFSLPWSAVSTTLTLTIRVRKYQAPFGEFWTLDGGPEGTVFNYPLYVQPNNKIISGSRAVLYFYNPKTKLWEVEEVERQSNPQIPIYHFSKYGISN